MLTVAIQAVYDERMTKILQMYPDLMHPARIDPDVQYTEVFKIPYDLIFCDRGLASFVYQHFTPRYL